MAAVGKNIAHDSAPAHVTGDSVFLDDVAPLPGELLAGIVPSPFAHGRLQKLDLSAAAAVPGVAAVLTHRDVPGDNLFGAAVKDELLLVEEEVVFLGQPLAVIAADSADALHHARRAAVVEMEELPAIFGIDEAVSAGFFLGAPRKIERGDVQAVFASAHRV